MSDPSNEIANTGGPASSAEPSMEEILASIRRILKDDQPGAGATEQRQEEEEDSDILVLDATMMVKPVSGGPQDYEPASTPLGMSDLHEPEPILPEPSFHEPGEPEPAYYTATTEGIDNQNADPEPGIGLETPEPFSDETIANESNETDTAAAMSWEETNMSDETEHNVQPPQGLVGEAASNAAAGSIGALIRSISSDRSIAIGRPGLTLEDLVREELRPLLKSWLDSNLPPLVERIVRAEIQRVVERSIT